MHVRWRVERAASEQNNFRVVHFVVVIYLVFPEFIFCLVAVAVTLMFRLTFAGENQHRRYQQQQNEGTVVFSVAHVERTNYTEFFYAKLIARK